MLKVNPKSLEEKKFWMARSAQEMGLTAKEVDINFWLKFSSHSVTDFFLFVV